MRTTVTLDPDAEALIRQQMTQRRVSFKAALNDAIRRGLRPDGRAGSKPYRVKPFRSSYHNRVDRLHLNQLAEEIETERFLRKQARRK